MTPSTTEVQNTNCEQSYVNSAWMTRSHTRSHTRRASKNDIQEEGDESAAEVDNDTFNDSSALTPSWTSSSNKRIRNASVLLASRQGPAPRKQDTENDLK